MKLLQFNLQISNLHYVFQKEVFALHVTYNTSRHRLQSRANLKMDLSPIRNRTLQRLSTIELLSNPTITFIYKL